MKQALCVRLCCECGQEMVWAADVRWLAEQGLDVAGSASFLSGSQRLPLPRDARNVTGMPNARCPQCFQVLPVLSLMRARYVAGAGVVLDLPSQNGRTAPPGADAPVAIDRGARLLNRDGRRARRSSGESGLEGLLSSSVGVTIVDISSLGICAQHTHPVQAGTLYVLAMRLPPHPEKLRIQARAVWTVPHRIEKARGDRQTIYRSGFEFVEVSAQTVAALEAYVAARLARRQAEAVPSTPRK